MASYEMWTCDYHDADHCAGSSTMEDQARDEGWVVFHRRQFRETVFPAIAGTSIQEFRLPARWHDDYLHICAGCLKDPDFEGWLPHGYEPNFSEDKEAYERARA